MERKAYILGLFSDLKRAFGIVQRGILLKKLHHYGMHGVALNLI